MTSDNTQKVIWLTGGSAGIGAATAKELARQGHIVCISARSLEPMQKFAEEASSFEGQIKPYELDITKPKQVEEVVAKIEKDVGKIDIAILNAGFYDPDSLREFTSKSFKKHFDVNVIGTGYCLEAVLKRFIERDTGHVCIVASVAGYRGLPSSLCYGPTKAALNNLAESLAIETKGTNIKVQVANPGFVETRLTDKNNFYMPMRITQEEAAEKFVKGLGSNAFEINFPLAFALILKCFKLLPNRVYIWLMRKVDTER
jgi:short-subunit dehydrogenase